MTGAKIWIILFTGLGLSACETISSERNFGNSVQQNMAVQIINPDPPVDQSVTPTSGEKIALGLKNYQEGKVIQPKTLKLQGSGKSTKSD